MSQLLEGIVLSRLEYGESTLIIDLYSKELGRTTLGAYKPKKKNNSFYFAPLNLIQVSTYTSPKTKYLRTKDVNSLLADQLISTDSEIHAIRYFLADFLKMTLNEHEADPSLYSFLTARIKSLYQTQQKSSFVIDFLEALSPYLGIDLMELRSDTTLLRDFGFSLNETEQDQLIQPNPKDKKSHLNALLKFYAHQFEGVTKLKSKEVLAAIFN